MGFLNKLLGYRWSLYFVKNGDQLVYTLSHDSVKHLLLMVATKFSAGKKPIEPWSLVLNFNHNHQTIKIEPEHFSSQGYPNDLILKKIEAIDSKWDVKTKAEPSFIEAATNRNLPISDNRSMQEMLDNVGKPYDTFYDILSEVFGTK